MSGEPLHHEDPTGRFSGRADSYARHRPDYPAEALQAVTGGLGCAPEPIAADWRIPQHEQPLDWDGVIGRLASTSYIPSSGPAWEELLAGMRALYDEFRDDRGIVRIQYETRVYLAEKA